MAQLRGGIGDGRSTLVIRSVLTSVGFLHLFLPALAVVGGYVPALPIINGFGRLLNTDLPWLVIGSAAASALALLALRLGGRRYTRAFAGLGLATVLANVSVGVQFAATAAGLGATYDLARQAQTAPDVDRAASQRVTYAEVEGFALRADIWPAGRDDASSPAGPGVLFIHGGGFTRGGLGLRPFLFAMLNDAGYTVADVEYRLAPPPRWQDARADVLCALGWFQREAGTFGVDPARIAVMGESAGGNLALQAAYSPLQDGGVGRVAPSCDVQPRAPAGLIAVYPTADLGATWADVRAIGGWEPFVETYTGGTPTDFPDRYRDGSVERLIGPGTTVPTFLISGVNDQLVRIERMRALAEMLRAAGTDLEYVEVPFADHAFDGLQNAFGTQLEETLLPRFLDRVTAPGS